MLLSVIKKKKMELLFKIKIAEKCWKDSLDWTFGQIDVLNKAYNGKGKIVDLEKSREILRVAKERNEEEKKTMKIGIEKIEINVKPVRNFKSSLEKLLHSTEIYFSDMKIPPSPFDLYDSIDNQELSKIELGRYIEKVKKNLETNWVAFNQSYGGMLIKIKLNDYEIK